MLIQMVNKAVSAITTRLQSKSPIYIYISYRHNIASYMGEEGDMLRIE